jgi:hypothetical protein
MWESRRLTFLWASTACYKDSFTFLLIQKRKKKLLRITNIFRPHPFGLQSYWITKNVYREAGRLLLLVSCLTHSLTLKRKTVCSSETLGCHTICSYNPDHENLKSKINKWVDQRQQSIPLGLTFEV